MPNKKVIRINQSSLRYLHCFRRYWNIVVEEIELERTSFNDMEYGSAWHIFHQELAESKNPLQAASLGQKYFAGMRNKGMLFKDKKEWLDENHLAGLCLDYINRFGIEKSWGKNEILESPLDGKPLVEQTFSIKFYESDSCVIFLQGTLDKICHYPAGFNCIEDEKSTGEWDIKGYLASYRMRPQLLFYTLALHLLADLPEGEYFREVIGGRIGARINGVFLKKDIPECTFQQSDVFFFRPDEIEEFKRGLIDVCTKIDIHLSLNNFPSPEGILNDSCPGNYRKRCEFWNYCASGEYERMISNLPRTPYAPLRNRKGLQNESAISQGV